MTFKVLKFPVSILIFIFINYWRPHRVGRVSNKAGHDVQRVTWTSPWWEWQSVRLAWCNASLCRTPHQHSAQLHSWEPRSSTSPSSHALSPSLLWCACTPLVPAEAWSTGTATWSTEGFNTQNLQVHLEHTSTRHVALDNNKELELSKVSILLIPQVSNNTISWFQKYQSYKK